MLAALAVLLPVLVLALRRPDGALIEGSDGIVSVASTLGEDGKPVGVVGRRRDLTRIAEEWPHTWPQAYKRASNVLQKLSINAQNSDDKKKHLDTIKRVLHTVRGKDAGSYMYQTWGIPKSKAEDEDLPWIPSMKMQYAVPGWQARTEDEADRVTSFPSYLALASSWDADLVFDVATAIADEFQTLGANVMLGPSINIHRSAVHEQEFDSLSGEDPVLGSVLVRAWVLATQTHGILAIPRAVGFKEQDAMHQLNKLANTTSFDINYPTFQTAIDVGAVGIMCADHEVDGLWSCRDKELLERDLRGIMDFKGIVVSEPGAAKDFFKHNSSFEHGLDLALDESLDKKYDIDNNPSVQKAYKKAFQRVMAAMARMKMFDKPGCQEDQCKEDLKKTATTTAHKRLARTAATNSVILLQNTGNLLPFTRGKVGKIAVFGPATTRKWHGHMKVVPYDVIEQHALDKDIVVTSDPKEEGVDACVVIGGTHDSAAHWKLDNDTMDAIEQSMSCLRRVVLLELPGAVRMAWRDRVDAIAMVYHLGENTAFSWSNPLFGDSNPSGKLVQTFPDYSGERKQWWLEVPPTYMDETVPVTFPFGHGLSYTNFSYLNPVEKPTHKCRRPLCIMVTIKNTGPFAGSEVVQAYFQFKPKYNKPRMLRGFKKTEVLQPGQSQKVFFGFSERDVSAFVVRNGETDKFRSWVPMTEFDVLLGSSSKDIRAKLRVHPAVPREED